MDLKKLYARHHTDKRPRLNMGEQAAYIVEERHWPVFPCHPDDKRPMTRKGFYDATMKDVGKLWEKNPPAMIGVPTGDKIGAFVVDINPPGDLDTYSCIEHIEERIGEVLPYTLMTETPNGLHLWFNMPDGIEIRNRGKLIEGAIDCIRGNGGYVIVPPSIAASGKKYRWMDEDVAIANAPDALIEIVRPGGK